MKSIAVLLLALSLAPLGSRSNSAAATKRGIADFAAKDFARSAASFDQADRLRRSALTAFNLGTARIAAGDREAAASALERALRDRSLRGDALYNRGTGALNAGDSAAAVRDLTAALRENPANVAAKRNLEIALRRQQAQQRAGQAGNDRRKGEPRNDGKEDAAGGRKPAPRAGDADLQQILRSVEQQELEELSRMRRPRGEPRVGW